MTRRRSFGSWGRAIARRRNAAPFNLDDAGSLRWDERAEAAADLLVANAADLRWDRTVGLRVADFGAGSERLHRALEPRLPYAYRYVGFDLDPQSESVVELDVTRELPAEDFDVVFCLGLLEYIRPLEPFLARLRARYPALVMSYSLFDAPHRLTRRERRKRGWLTDYSKADLDRAFQVHGLLLRDFRLTNQERTGVWLLARPIADD